MSITFGISNYSHLLTTGVCIHFFKRPVQTLLSLQLAADGSLVRMRASRIQFHLFIPKPEIESLFPHQFILDSPFCDLPLLQDDDEIRVGYDGQLMRAMVMMVRRWDETNSQWPPKKF
jgi:hypothetical protein